MCYDVTMLDTHSNRYCFSKYLCYDTGLYIIFKCNLRARTKNTAARADEHMLNFKLIRNDYNCFIRITRLSLSPLSEK